MITPQQPQSKDWESRFDEAYCGFEFSCDETQTISKPQLAKLKSFIQSLLAEERSRIVRESEAAVCTAIQQSLHDVDDEVDNAALKNGERVRVKEVVKATFKALLDTKQDEN